MTVIVAGKAYVVDRERYLEAHHDLIARCRAAPGCLDVAISPDPLEPERVNIFEHWESAAALEAWRAVASAPDLADQIRDVAVAKHVVAHSGPPFD